MKEQSHDGFLNSWDFLIQLLLSGTVGFVSIGLISRTLPFPFSCTGRSSVTSSPSVSFRGPISLSFLVGAASLLARLCFRRGWTDLGLISLGSFRAIFCFRLFPHPVSLLLCFGVPVGRTLHRLSNGVHAAVPPLYAPARYNAVEGWRSIREGRPEEECQMD